VHPVLRCPPRQWCEGTVHRYSVGRQTNVFKTLIFLILLHPRLSTSSDIFLFRLSLSTGAGLCRSVTYCCHRSFIVGRPRCFESFFKQNIQPRHRVAGKWCPRGGRTFRCVPISSPTCFKARYTTRTTYVSSHKVS